MDGSIVGREQELQSLDQACTSARLIAVIGPPGVGKSKLLEFWAETRAALDVVRCPVDGASGASELESKVAQALGVPLPSSASGLHALLAGHGKMWLWLDGIDRLPLPDLESTLRAWLAAAPELRVITSSREAWAADVQLRVAPLSRERAAQLFVERARAAGYRPRHTEDEHRAIDELVARLDGLPLAISLAGARASVLSPQQIRARLDRELPSGPLHAALELSWAMLTPLERRVLAVASQFRGAFHVLLLEATLDERSDDVLAAFESLVGKSLVQRTDEGHAAVWFRLLETVRRFAAVHVDPSLPFAERLAHRASLLATQLDTHEESSALEELAGLADDLAHVTRHDTDPRCVTEAGIALAAWGVPRGLVDPELLEICARAAATRDPDVRGLARYWLARGQNRAGAVNEAEREVEHALEDPALSPPLRAKLEILRAHLWLERGELDRARAALLPVPPRLLHSREPFLEGELANVRGRIAEAAGELDTAAEAFVAARALYRRAGALRQAGRALQNLAIVRDAQGCVCSHSASARSQRRCSA